MLSSTDLLSRGRSRAEANMLDTCTITRPDSDAPPPVMDPTTLQYPEVARITVYTGKCRVQVRNVMSFSAEAGERQVTNQDLELQLPVDGTESVTVGDVVHIDAATSDASLEGRVYTVRARHEKSQATARRLRVTEGVA